jgi:hypothetical protein
MLLFLPYRYQISSIHCISVRYVVIVSIQITDFQCSLYFYKICYYFCHIILSSIEPVKMNTSDFHISLYAVLVLLMSEFKILEFHCSSEINNKWKPVLLAKQNFISSLPSFNFPKHKYSIML